MTLRGTAFVFRGEVSYPNDFARRGLLMTLRGAVFVFRGTLLIIMSILVFLRFFLVFPKSDNDRFRADAVSVGQGEYMARLDRYLRQMRSLHAVLSPIVTIQRWWRRQCDRQRRLAEV
jgi:hypothetical protein